MCAWTGVCTASVRRKSCVHISLCTFILLIWSWCSGRGGLCLASLRLAIAMAISFPGADEGSRRWGHTRPGQLDTASGRKRPLTS